MDVAVIRCLLIKHWSEGGIYWALRYLLNRLSEIEIYRNEQRTFRSRANSAPTAPHLKIFSSEQVCFLYMVLIINDHLLNLIFRKLLKNLYNSCVTIHLPEVWCNTVSIELGKTLLQINNALLIHYYRMRKQICKRCNIVHQLGTIYNWQTSQKSRKVFLRIIRRRLALLLLLAQS